MELERLEHAMRQWNRCEITIINYKKDGDEFWNRFNVSPLADSKGLYTHWIFIQRDVTETRQSEMLLYDMNNNLQKHVKELAKSNAELEQFAYVTSHDLQEPLRMVTSFLTQIENKYADLLDERGRTYIGFAVDGARRMRQIILDLLEFSRIGRTEEKKEALDLNDVVEEIKILFRKEIAEKNGTILFGVLPVVNTFKAPVRQVFQNLISNALKYSRAGIPSEILITVSDCQSHWQFKFSDNGIGIEEEYFEKIFVIFQRLHGKEDFPGTGMGLAVTKKIIENQGGKIWLTSVEGKGTVFYFTLLKAS